MNPTTLFVFRIRKFCHWLITLRHFDNFILGCILISSLLLAFEDQIDESNNTVKTNLMLNKLIFYKTVSKEFLGPTWSHSLNFLVPLVHRYLHLEPVSNQPQEIAEYSNITYYNLLIAKTIINHHESENPLDIRPLFLHRGKTCKLFFFSKTMISTAYF